MSDRGTCGDLEEFGDEEFGNDNPEIVDSDEACDLYEEAIREKDKTIRKLRKEIKTLKK